MPARRRRRSRAEHRLRGRAYPGRLVRGAGPPAGQSRPAAAPPGAGADLARCAARAAGGGGTRRLRLSGRSMCSRAAPPRGAPPDCRSPPAARRWPTRPTIAGAGPTTPMPREGARERYLKWEIELVHQIEREGDVGFRVPESVRLTGRGRCACPDEPPPCLSRSRPNPLSNPLPGLDRGAAEGRVGAIGVRFGPRAGRRNALGVRRRTRRFIWRAIWRTRPVHTRGQRRFGRDRLQRRCVERDAAGAKALRAVRARAALCNAVARRRRVRLLRPGT